MTQIRLERPSLDSGIRRMVEEIVRILKRVRPVDEVAPGNDMFYGTNSSGEKGWYLQEDIVGRAYTLRTDEDATYLWMGEADPGSLESDAVWRIRRMTLADDTILWADGNANFDNIWNDRATITYS